MKNAAQCLQKAKRIVIKIGSALLVDGSGSRPRQGWLNALADDIADLVDQGKEVAVVSSGAIAVGRVSLGLLQSSALRLEEKQAAAAHGQILLAHAYQEALSKHERTVSQVLLTIEDTEIRRRYLNARNTLETLLRLGSVPVINENDTVATVEIRYGDNDRLAARVAAMINADALIVLSDIDGLYSADPKGNPDALFYPLVEEITEEIEKMAGDAVPGFSKGGMKTKIMAAKIAVAAGASMIIADGREHHPVQKILEGERATVFTARMTPRTAKKRFIAGNLKTCGRITIDDGAIGALKGGKSLLPSGVTSVDGDFQSGDCVKVLTHNGGEIARGLIAYDAQEARLIMGRRSADIATLIGYHGRDELIHRDDLALL